MGGARGTGGQELQAAGLLGRRGPGEQVLLWRRHPWGCVLEAVLLTAGAVTQLTYLLALRSQAAAGIPGATGFDPQEPPTAVAIVAAATALLVGLRRPPSPGAVAA